MLGISVSTSDDAPGMVELVMSEDTSSPSSFEENDEETCELQDKNVFTGKEQYNSLFERLVEYEKQSVVKKLEMQKLESLMSEDTASTSSFEETNEETCELQDKNTSMITEKKKYMFRFERLYEYGKQSVAKKLEMQKLKLAQERHRETVFRKKFFKKHRFSVRC